MRTPGWEAWERDVVAELGLEATLASGSQPHDPGDATTYEHPNDGVGFQIMADAKFTEHASFSIGRKFWESWTERAGIRGKRFIMPLRLWPRGARDPVDLVVLDFQDFRELLESHRLVTALDKANQGAS